MAIIERVKLSYWQSPSHYALALLCWSNTFQNAHKFPELVYKYGNIQVLIPYLVVTLILIVPITFTELVIGQYTNHAFVNIWRMAPLFRGIAWSTATLVFFVANYSLFTTTQSVYYLLKAFETTLPWSKCDPRWAKANCYNTIEPEFPINESAQNSVEHFHKEFVLGENAMTFSDVNVRLFVFVLATLCLVGFSLINRTKTIEKILNAINLIPFLLLVTLTIASFLNSSDLSSLSFLVNPNFELLTNFNMWVDVINNALANIGVAMGGLICIAAHAPFRSNVYTMAIFTPLFNLLVDTLFTLFVYSTILEQAIFKNTTFEALFEEDSSLLFVKLPAIILEWPLHAQLWTVCYFLYLYLIGIRYVIFLMFVLTAGFHETFHCVYYLKKFSIAMICLMLTFVMPLYISPVGNMMYTQMEAFCSTTFITVTATLQFIGIYYLYNAKRLVVDVHFMLNKRPRCLEYVMFQIPLILAAVSIVNLTRWLTMSRDYRTQWIFIIQLVVLSLMIVFWLGHFLVYAAMNWSKGTKWLLQPTANWGCSNEETRRNREFFKSKEANARFSYRQELYNRTVVVPNVPTQSSIN